MNDNNKSYIFLSYTHEDIGFAKRVYQDLKRFGLTVWFDNESLMPGQDWKNTIEKAIKDSTYFIALLSNDSMSKRGFINKEMKIAFQILEQCNDNDIYLIPVRLDECTPSHLKINDYHWVDVFPESKYLNGIKKILEVIKPEATILRSKGRIISDYNAYEMIRKYNYFDIDRNRDGKGLFHQYKELNDGSLILDETTGLMWQSCGSNDEMVYEDISRDTPRLEANEWIQELNHKTFEGYDDWRIPTLDELMSLMERKKNIHGLYINPVFDPKYKWIMTSDKESIAKVWIVFFASGFCEPRSNRSSKAYIRAVRSAR